MPIPASLRTWSGVMALALAAFVFNTTEFAPVGLLSDIGRSFGMPVHEVGWMLTIYAWVVASASLPLMLLTRKMERRGLLVAVFGLFIASHVVCGMARNFGWLLAGRIGIAFAHSLFWSITAALAARISPPGKQAMGLSLLATGTSLAMVLGIPLGRVVGQWLGWRATFVAIAAASALVLLILRCVLPPLPSARAGSLSNLPQLLRRPIVLALYALTVVAISGHFIAYSYIEPFTQRVAHLGSGETTALLLVFGGTGIFGSLLFSRSYDQYPQNFMYATLAVLAASMLLLAPAARHFPALYLQAAIWGIAAICFNLGMQAKILHHASDASDLAMSLFSALYNVGIGAGALLGGQIAEHAGLQAIGMYGGTLALVGLPIYAYAVAKLRAQAALTGDKT